MPEGDTIHRSASTLDRVLAGGTLRSFDAPRWTGVVPRPGWLVEAAEARGKHLLVHFASPDGVERLSLRTHLRMNGSWHVYRPGERWQRPRASARVVIETDRAVAVCFAAPVVEVVARDDLSRHPELVRLGPDLAGSEADIDEAVRRMARFGADVEVGVALLDQRIACGVGNVYKSEVLFACRVNPFAGVDRLDLGVRRELLATASRQLRSNLDGYPRRTVPEGLAVYGRAGRACLRCGTPISSRRQGSQARTTYWCPACQGDGG